MTTTEKGIVSDIARGVDWLADGNNNWTRLRHMVNQQWGPRPAAFSGLDYAYFGGTGWNGSAWTAVADGTITLADDDDNYVERTAAGVVSTNTTGFTASKIPMAVVTTASGAITAISERRQEQVPSGAPAAHATSHEDGGSDEMDVTGLSGLLADAQTPLAHKTSHQSGGSDAIKLDDLAAPDDNTDLNATSGHHGLLPKLSGSATDVLLGDGTFGSVPAGGYTDEQAQDAVGAMVAATTEITPTYVDATPALTFDLNNNSVNVGRLHATATSRIFGRKTASAGAGEECTLSEVLDFIGSAARGDILVRGAATWQRLAKGSAGQVLKSDGTDPGWVDVHYTVPFIIDGGGATITTGLKGGVQVDVPGTIVAVTVLALDGNSGSIVIDIWKDSYANHPPTVADTITASAKPTVSSATKSTDATLTGWTTSIAAGDILFFNVDSVTTFQRVLVSLKVKKT